MPEGRTELYRLILTSLGTDVLLAREVFSDLVGTIEGHVIYFMIIY